MKKILLFIAALVSAASLASAANNVSYTATADPNSSPDGVDQSANPVDVWTVTTTPGFNGSDGQEVTSGRRSDHPIWAMPGKCIVIRTLELDMAEALSPTLHLPAELWQSDKPFPSALRCELSTTRAVALIYRPVGK